MADPMSPYPAHAIFAFLITTIAMVVQMHFPNSSPSDKYSANLWIFMACLFLYAFSSAYYKSHAFSTSNNETPYFKLSFHLAVISGSMACTALISVLVSKPVIAVIIFIYFICHLIYFAPNTAYEICKKMGSFVYHMCKGIQHDHNPKDDDEPV